MADLSRRSMEQQAGLFGGDDKRAKRDKEFTPVTPDGTPLNEAVSVLIKEMRRGREIEALYWARQIESHFYKYLWRRLAIFAAEDVGIGNPDAIVQIRALWESYMQIREESSRTGVDGNLLAMAILLLCRSDKSREGDYLWGLVDDLKKRDWTPEIPDYAIDTHTKRGRKKYGDNQSLIAKLWYTVWSAVVPRWGPQDYLAWHAGRLYGEGVLSKDEYDQFMAEIGDERYHPPGTLPEW